MSRFTHDIIYGLDGDHIADVSKAVTTGTTVSVTHVGLPPRVFVDTTDRRRVLTALHQVGYDTASINGDLVVTGWNAARLAARVTSLTSTLERLRYGLSDTAARAVDTYATRPPPGDRPLTPGAEREESLQAVSDLLRHEIDTITGPHARHDPHIRPVDPQVTALFGETRRLEHAISRELHLAHTVATYAIDAYTELRANEGYNPSDARAGAITRAMAKVSSDARRRYANSGIDRRAPDAPGPPLENEAARLAANDIPRPSTDIDQHPPGPADHGDATPTATPPPASALHKRAS